MRETAKIFMQMKSGSTDKIYRAISYLFLFHQSARFTEIWRQKLEKF